MDGSRTPLSRSLNENVEVIRERRGVGVSLAIIERELVVGGKPAVAFFVDGFAKDKVSLDVIFRLQELERSELVPNTIKKLLRREIAYTEVDTVETIEDVIDQVLSGPMVFLFEGERTAIAVDVREYPVRSLEEPDLERVTRGSHEGFVEPIIFNTALIRRRLRDPNLRFETLHVGRRSKTDVVIGYIGDVTDPDLVDEVKKRLNKISVDALPTGSKNIEEFLVVQPWNPLPKVRYTERPDVAVAHLLEGHVLVMVDTTPMVMILPVTIFHF